MKPTLRIMAVDDHQLFLYGLAECLRSLPGVEEVVTCTSFREMKTVIANWVPDIIFLDLNLQGDDGFNICTEIKAVYKHTCVAIMTQYELKKFVDKARACGAGAYFIKNTDVEVLAAFIQRFGQNRNIDFYVHMPVVLDSTRSELFNHDFFEMTRLLSKREREIMHLLVKGMGHTEIPVALNITYDTFKTHRTNILQKLNVKNVAELLLLAMQNRLESVKQN